MPWAGEETGADVSVSALPDFAFVTEEDVSGVPTGGKEGVSSAAELTGGAAGCEAGAAEAADAFDSDVECAGTSAANESRKYHPPLAAATIRPAAIAIQIPLLLPRDRAGAGVLSLRKELPNSGGAGVCLGLAVVFFTVAVACFSGGADLTASGAFRSTTCGVESLTPSSTGGAVMDALRASGSSQAGIFISSPSKQMSRNGR